MVGHDLSGLHVLDAFGGSGLLGFEAWSRGADVTIVERRASTARAIRQSARALGAEVDTRVGDVLRLAPDLGPFDGVLADPPYALEPAPILATLAPLARGWLVFEAEAHRRPPEAAGGLSLARERRFGGTVLWVYRLEA
jgi:16S rRNA (guanine966-N2)-methyltransferase